MEIIFYKYQGTGNDFIIIDNRDLTFDRSHNSVVAKLCDRRFGIGADGLMLLQKSDKFDFEMVYFNSDGNESSMCGNGGRCIVEFARTLDLVKENAHFIAIDGEHEAVVKTGFVSLKMNDVNNIDLKDKYSFLNTGSPHFVAFVENIANYNVFAEGEKIRNNELFKPGGTNVNFIEKQGDSLFVRTFERGVEAETYSCGTGVTAAALVAAVKKLSTSPSHCDIKTLGGNLTVKFTQHNNNSFTDIWLEGPAAFVFKGKILISE